MTLADVRPAKPAPISANALILIAVFAGLTFALARMDEPPGVLTFAFVVVGWILSVVVHEFAHAFVAYKAGDHTIVEKGYLTLDPLKYTDLSTSLVLPLIALALGGIGFPGGAVYLRDDLMRSRRGRALASLAGPLGTLAVLIGLAAVPGRRPGLRRRQASPLSRAAAFLAFLQAFALVLNLLPLPSLDGFGVIRPYLPADVQRAGREGRRPGVHRPVPGDLLRAAGQRRPVQRGPDHHRPVDGPDIGAGYPRSDSARGRLRAFGRRCRRS
jgi:Zn-dependent protease